MELSEYKIGDKVQVLLSVPKRGSPELAQEWRNGEVVKITTVYPTHSERFKPYPMVYVKTIRTYFNPETKDVYDKEGVQGVIFSNELKPNYENRGTH